MKRIGLLWDSLSPNTGDQAIGTVLRRALTEAAIPHKVISPIGTTNIPKQIAALIIGGGELIRKPGNPFYDVFRVDGPNILNTVGVLDGSETEYLRNYRLVSVRSNSDQAKIGFGTIAPCLTTLYKQYLPAQKDTVEIPDGAIGLHFTYGFSEHLQELVSWLRSGQLKSIVFLPVTPYNADVRLMEVISKYLPGSVVIDPIGPDQLFRTIGKFKVVLTSSLHATIFAHAQGVPFLAISGPEKIRSFLVERNLEQRLVSSAEEIRNLLPQLAVQGEDSLPSRVEDMRAAAELLQEMLSECDRSLRSKKSSERIGLRPTGQRAYEQEIDVHTQIGLRTAFLLENSLSIELDERASDSPEEKLVRRWYVLKDSAFPFGSLRRAVYDEVFSTAADGLVRWAVRRRDDVIPSDSPLRQILDAALQIFAGSADGLAIIFRHVSRVLRLSQLVISGRWGLVRDFNYFKRPQHAILDPEYRAYLERTEPGPYQLTQMKANSSAGPVKFALVSIMGEIPLPILEEATESVLAQTYASWTWQMVDMSGSLAVREHLNRMAISDSRVAVVKPFSDRKAQVLNELISGMEGDYLISIDPSGTLAPWALSSLAEVAARNPGADWIYSDYDQLDNAGYRVAPNYKPDWSPEMMLSDNLLINLSAIERKFLGRLGILDREMGDAAVLDFCLRGARMANQVIHVPEILCHLRSTGPGFAGDPIIPNAQIADQKRALETHLSGLGLREPNVEYDTLARLRCSWKSEHHPTVSVVIPSRDQSPMLRRCLISLFDVIAYPNLEVVVVDTGSQEVATERLYAEISSRPQFNVVDDEGSFNFGRACNTGAKKSQGELILFLNNDAEFVEPSGIEAMARWFEVPGIGAVGAKLLYPDGSLQHAGVIVGMGGLASHLYQHQTEGRQDMFGGPDWYRNLSAVTAACMMVSRQAFEQANGFSQEFQLNYSDVDFCLRLRERGWRIVYTPDARLIHQEGATHNKRIPRRDFELASERWSENEHLSGDPYFNPNLSYMNPAPKFRRSRDDNPKYLNHRLMTRLSNKSVIQLPDDLA